MEDENQRRTWEYLQGITRKEGSYGKILSDVFVAALDGQMETETDRSADSSLFPLVQDKDIFEKILDRVFEQKFPRKKLMMTEWGRCRRQNYPRI